MSTKIRIFLSTNLYNTTFGLPRITTTVHGKTTMAAPLSGTVYFQVDFVGIKDLPTRRAFLKAAVDEDIGTAISRILPREDLMV